MQWRLNVFGTLEAQSPEGQCIVWSGTRAGLLLAYLSLHPDKAHLRETLAEWLWAEGDTSTKRVRLRQEIGALRQVFDGASETEPLLITRTHITLRSAHITTDIQQFDRAVAEAASLADSTARIVALKEAAAVYRGDLLLAYPDHFLAERTYYSQQYEKVLSDLATLQRQAEDYAGAVNTQSRLVARDPLREETHADLMRLYAAIDEPSLMRRQYQELARFLKAELGEAPSEAVQRLYRELRKDANDSIPLDPLPPKQEPPVTAPTAPVSPHPSSEQVPTAIEDLPEPNVSEYVESASPAPDTPPIPALTDALAASTSQQKIQRSAHFSGFSKVVVILTFLLVIGLATLPFLKQPATHKPTVSPTPLSLQQQGEEWIYYYKPKPGEKTNAEAKAIARISQDKFAVTGLIDTEKDDADFLTVFLNRGGTVYAMDRYSSPGHDCDRAFAVVGDHRGSVFVAGETYVPGSPQVEGWYLTLIKYNVEGKRLWVRQSPVRTKNFNHIVKVVPDGLGGACIAGTAEEGKIYKILLLRYDPDGKPLWKQTLAAGNGKSTILGNLLAVAGTEPGFIVCGTAQMAETENGMDSDWVVARFAMNGKREWMRTLDGGAHKEEAAVSILQNRVSDLYIGGFFTTAAGGTQLGLARFSQDGRFHWKQVSAASGPEVAFKTMAMEYFRGDYIYLVGDKVTLNQQTSVVIACFNPGGYLKWENTYSNPVGFGATSVISSGVLPDGNLYLSGEIGSAPKGGEGWSGNLWTASYHADGSLLTQHFPTESPSGETSQIVRDMHGVPDGIYIVGQARHPLDDNRFMVVKYPPAP